MQAGKGTRIIEKMTKYTSAKCDHVWIKNAQLYLHAQFLSAGGLDAEQDDYLLGEQCSSDTRYTRHKINRQQQKTKS